MDPAQPPAGIVGEIGAGRIGHGARRKRVAADTPQPPVGITGERYTGRVADRRGGDQTQSNPNTGALVHSILPESLMRRIDMTKPGTARPVRPCCARSNMPLYFRARRVYNRPVETSAGLNYSTSSRH